MLCPSVNILLAHILNLSNNKKSRYTAVHCLQTVAYNKQKITQCLLYISNACTWSTLSPVKQNMPIWSVMCCQLCFEPSAFKLLTSCVRIEMMRSAIRFTSLSLYHDTHQLMQTHSGQFLSLKHLSFGVFCIAKTDDPDSQWLNAKHCQGHIVQLKTHKRDSPHV